MRIARRVRAGGAGKRAGGDTGTAPWADLTTHVSRAMAELIAARDWLAALVKIRLRRMRYRPGLLEGFLAKAASTSSPSVTLTIEDRK